MQTNSNSSSHSDLATRITTAISGLYEAIMPTIRYLDILVALFAGLSLMYAFATASGRSIDLRAFHDGAQAWVTGTYKIGEGPMYEYPPYSVVLLSPLALLSFQHLIYFWLLLNLVATMWINYAAIQLWGKNWPARARYYFLALLVISAPFRVTLRNGQLSLIICALLLGALLARKLGKDYLAGCLLGLALCKYSLSLPFVLYFAWKKEWKIMAPACLLPVLLTEIFALRSGLSIFVVALGYIKTLGKIVDTRFAADTGSTEIQMLFVSLTDGNRLLTTICSVSLCLLALIAMAFVFKRSRADEHAHFAILSLFSLWAVYHRNYDEVLCIILAALLIGFLVRRKYLIFSLVSLSCLMLLALSIPGILIERLGIDTETLSHNPFGFIGLHIERFIVFGLFCGLLFLLVKRHPEREGLGEIAPLPNS